MKDPRTIVFTGGGTGGHVYPGIAVAERLRRDFSGRIVWFGSKKESDRRSVEEAGFEYLALPSGKLRRQLSLENVADAFRVAAGYFAARRALSALRPALLFSKGGYVSVPPCAAAAALGIPVFTHESDLSPGLATRLNAGRAERILLAYEATRAFLPESQRDRAVVVGNPIRAAIRAGDAARGREFLAVPPGLPVLLFLGGSQGARQVNELVEAALPGLTARAFVAHQTGEEGRAAKPANPAVAARYRAFAYLREEMPQVLAAADIVVGRSGAGTLWEAGALGKPMILIPLAGSGTRGDQVDNARLFERAGAARVLLGTEVRPERLLEEISRFLDKPEARAEAGRAAFELAGMDGAEAAASLILERIGAGT